MKQRNFKTFALLLALILIFSILNPSVFAMTTDPHIHESCSEHDHDAESLEIDSEAAADKSQDASQGENILIIVTFHPQEIGGLR